MNCQNCGAPMKLILAKRQFVCNHCTTCYFPEENQDGVRVLGEQSHGLCPLCRQSRLIFATVADKTVLYCKECRGLLLQIRELMPIIQALRSQRLANAEVIPAPIDRSELLRKIKCSVCKQTMTTYQYGGGGNVHIDSCVDCGVLWLDYNELNRIVLAPSRPPLVHYRTMWEQPGVRSYYDKNNADNADSVDVWGSSSVLTSSLNGLLDLLF